MVDQKILKTMADLRDDAKKKKIIIEELSIVKCLTVCQQTEENNLLSDWRTISFVRSQMGKYSSFVFLSL